MKFFLAGLVLVLTGAALRVISRVWVLLYFVSGKRIRKTAIGGNMQRQDVNSTRIKSVGFQDGTLEIEFHGSGRVYQYTGSKVQEHYNGLMAANTNGESVGQYFNRNVRHCPDTAYREVKEDG